MALAEICGLQDFDSYKMKNIYENDLNKLCENFVSQMQLAVPPFSNVSINWSVKYCLYIVWILSQPAENLSKFTKDESGREIKMTFDHGTTTLGFMYKGGVVLAVDSRATGGQFIGSQTMKKIVEINDFLLGKVLSF